MLTNDLHGYLRAKVFNGEQVHFEDVKLKLIQLLDINSQGLIANTLSDTAATIVNAFPEERYELKFLEGIESSDYQNRAMKVLPKTIVSPEQHLYAINDGFVAFINNYPFIGSPNGIYLDIGSRYSALASIPDISQYISTLPVITNTGQGCVISDDCWQPANYCHWMFDWLTRLSLLPIDLTGNISIPLPIASLGKWVTNSLDNLELGVTLTPLYFSSDVIFRFEKLFVSSTLGAPIPHPANKMSSINVNFLRSKFSKNEKLEEKSGLRIYIDRADAKRGAGINFIGDLDLFLKQNNIQKVILGELSIQEQANIFSNADLVIGLHGAGLTNIVFCKIGTKVVEIFSPNFGSPAYAITAGKLQLDYIPLTGRVISQDAHKDIAHQTVYFDLDVLKHYLK